MKTRTIELPSRGLVYPENSPLATGKLEMKYMTARQDDILQNFGLIEAGTMLDHLLKSMLVNPSVYEQLVAGDQDALVYWARILGPGKDYEFDSTCPKCKTIERIPVDLEDIIGTSIVNPEWNRKNEYTITLPQSKDTVVVKLLTVADMQKASKESDGFTKTGDPRRVTTKLRQIVIKVNGETPSFGWVDTDLTLKDSRFIQKYVNEMMPTFQEMLQIQCPACGHTYETKLPFDMISFFYPRED